jgi:hypothetical protein
MNIRAAELGERQLLNLVTLTGLDAQSAPIRDGFRALLDGLPDAPARPVPSRTLTTSGYPAELGLTIDRGGTLGLKYTVDLFSSSGATGALETVRRYARVAPLPQLERCAGSVLERVTNSDVSVYWSAGFARDAEPRMRMHLIGHDGAFGPYALRGLVSCGCDSTAIDALLRAAESVGRSGIDFVGLGVDGGGRLRCKGYLGTNLYMDLRSVTRLASALGLSTGRALALVRWYRHFIGDHVGQLGAFGVGVDLMARAGRGAVEAYAYPGNVDLARLRPRIDALVRGRGHANTLAKLWALVDGDSPAGMYLAGCGTETATFARLGQVTIYLGVGDGQHVASSESRAMLDALTSARAHAIHGWPPVVEAIAPTTLL